ncbi:MAG: hypothetical protein ACRDTS_14115 [Mycobacterium sp.]
MGKHSARKDARTKQDAAPPSPEQPSDDWLEQQADHDPDAFEPDEPATATDRLAADDADVAEQSRSLPGEPPYPHD